MDLPAARAALERGSVVYRDAWPAQYVDVEFGPADEGYPHVTDTGAHYQMLLCSYGERLPLPYVPTPADEQANDWREL